MSADDDALALLRFSQHLLPMVHAKPFEHVMLIDGTTTGASTSAAATTLD